MAEYRIGAWDKPLERVLRHEIGELLRERYPEKNVEPALPTLCKSVFGEETDAIQYGDAIVHGVLDGRSHLTRKPIRLVADIVEVKSGGRFIWGVDVDRWIEDRRDALVWIHPNWRTNRRGKSPPRTR